MLMVSLTTKSIRDSKLLGLVVKIRATSIHQCKLIDLGISWVLYVIFTCTHCVFQCGIHVFVQTHMCIRACAEYVPMDVFFYIALLFTLWTGVPGLVELVSLSMVSSVSSCPVLELKADWHVLLWFLWVWGINSWSYPCGKSFVSWTTSQDHWVVTILHG